MRETNLQGKACVVPLAVAAGLGIAGMGLVSDGIVAADTTSVTDTISVGVLPSCTFNNVEDETYNGSAANGAEVNNFNDDGVHEFNLFCNDNNGFIVTATPYDLEATGVDEVISYVGSSYTPSGVNSVWTAAIASDAAGVTVVPFAPVGGGTIISSNSSTTASGVTFTATYDAYVGTAMPAGTYTGTIIYTLTASGTSSNSNSGNGGGSGDNSGNEVTDGPDSGDSGAGGGGTGGDSGTGGKTTDNSSTGGSGTGTGGNGSGDANSAPNNAPFAVNNTYTTYSTTNTYNTTNYSGGGAGTMGTQVATNGSVNDVTDGTTSEGSDDKSGSGVESDYEKPLGVTTSTSPSSSSDKKSGVDPMPLIVAGVLAAAGTVGAVALARSDKEEE